MIIEIKPSEDIPFDGLVFFVKNFSVLPDDFFNFFYFLAKSPAFALFTRFIVLFTRFML